MSDRSGAKARTALPGAGSSTGHRSVKPGPGGRILDMDVYVPGYLVRLNNPLSRGASKLYLRRFGVGIAEWRLLAMLAIEPNIRAQRICEFLGMDKAAASRSLARLAQGRLIDHQLRGADVRQKIWRLSAKGQDMHERILAVALQREDRLLAGVDPADLEVFLKVARQMVGNIASLDD